MSNNFDEYKLMLIQYQVNFYKQAGLLHMNVIMIQKL